MTRYTNLEKKKKFGKATAFKVTPLVPEQDKKHESQEGSGEAKQEHDEEGPVNNGRTLDREHSENEIRAKDPKSKSRTNLKKGKKRKGSDQVDRGMHTGNAKK